MSKELDDLIKGYQTFRKEYFENNNIMFQRLLKFGQKPKTLIIACSDSRVDPSLILQCDPGDLFMVRNVANLVPPYEMDDSYHGTSAALEFGVCVLEVKNIIIFGHTQCGGIKALLENEIQETKGFIGKWMRLAQPVYDIVTEKYAHLSLDEKITLSEQYSLVNSLNNLRTFPWIKQRILGDRLSLHAWYFDLKTGLIHCFDEESQQFKELALEESQIQG